ncbi:hypothetical protein MRX96_051911 [Rhipicephalus microplus]
MMADMGVPNFAAAYLRYKCMQAVELTLPLAKWKAEHDTMGDKASTWEMLRLSCRAFDDAGRVYGQAFRSVFAAVTKRVLSNAYNMSLPWGWRVTIDLLKKSMRRPRHLALHPPGIASYYLYRNLVAREVVVHNHMRSPPLLQPWFSFAVNAALVSTIMAQQLVLIGYFVFYFDEDYSYDAANPIYRQLEPLVKDIRRFETAFNRSGALANHTSNERRELLFTSWAVHSTSHIPRLAKAAVGRNDATKAGESTGGRQSYFAMVPEDQLFFLVSCFTRCGDIGRRLEVNRAICNIAPAFRSGLQASFQVRGQSLTMDQLHVARPSRRRRRACKFVDSVVSLTLVLLLAGDVFAEY